MFGFAWCAACMPAHDDWLKEWSSTPPMSSTMHALRLPPEDTELELDGELEGCWVAVLELGFEQPANSRVAAPSAATILTGWRNWISSFVPTLVGGKMFGSP